MKQILLLLVMIFLASATDTTTDVKPMLSPTTDDPYEDSTENELNTSLSPLVYITAGIAIFFLLICISSCIYNMITQKDFRARSIVLKNQPAGPSTCNTDLGNQFSDIAT